MAARFASWAISPIRRHGAAERYAKLHFCYEVGPTGYGGVPADPQAGPGLYGCGAIADPERPGERIKTNQRDAVTLAQQPRAGELVALWVPDAAHEAVRDLVCAREAAAQDLLRKRQQLLSFLLRHGRICHGRQHRVLAHRRWLAGSELRATGPADPVPGCGRGDRRGIAGAAATGTAARRDRAAVVDAAGRRILSGDARCLVSGGRHRCCRKSATYCCSTIRGN